MEAGAKDANIERCVVRQDGSVLDQACRFREHLEEAGGVSAVSGPSPWSIVLNASYSLPGGRISHDR
jgi:hypothetical protein